MAEPFDIINSEFTKIIIPLLIIIIFIIILKWFSNLKKRGITEIRVYRAPE